MNGSNMVNGSSIVDGSSMSNGRSMMNWGNWSRRMYRCMMNWSMIWSRGMYWCMMNWSMIWRRGMYCCMMNWSMRNSLITYICNVTSIMISMVLDMLGSSIREKYGVGSFNIPSSVSSFSGIEVGSRVFIMDSVLIAVRLVIFMVHRCWSMVGNRGMVRFRSWVGNRGMVRCRSRVRNRGMVRCRSRVGNMGRVAYQTIWLSITSSQGRHKKDKILHDCVCRSTLAPC